MTSPTSTQTADALIHDALEGRLPKQALAGLLEPESRRVFLEACGAIEKRLTHACATSGNPCLEFGCACDGEACLQPLLRAGSEYLSACGAEWAKLFANEANRDLVWKVTAGLN